MGTRTRIWLSLLSLAALIVGVVVFGRVQDAASVSLAECIEAPQACRDAELFIGYGLVLRVQGRAVYTRSWVGDLELAPWPAGSPLPSPGLHVSVVGAYGGGRTVIPQEVQLHPLRRRKEVTGAVMLLLWLLAAAAWVRHGWVRHDA